jgi:hypothetical protein
MRNLILVATAAFAVAGTAHATEVYRWVDKDGKVVYSDTPPPPGAKNAELRKLDKNAVEVDKTSFATRDAAKKSPVTLYANNCGEPCNNARQFLAKRGVPFASKNPESSQADADALKKLIGALEVPVLVVGKSPVKGFEPGSWDAALDSAGYPKSVAVAPPAAAAAKPAPVPAAPAAEPAPTAKPEANPPTPKY